MDNKRTLLFAICVSLAFFGVQAFFGTRTAPPASPTAAPIAEQRLVAQNSSINQMVSHQGEQFYVLETETQQLVFSTLGGALAEINLTLSSAENPNGLVHPIEADRLILKDSPVNARFPLHEATFLSSNGSQVRKIGAQGGYYPLLRRTILNANGSARFELHPQYYAMNLVNPEDPALSELTYRVTRFEPSLIQFEATSSRGRITKTFRIPAEQNGPYCLECSVRIDGDPTGLWLSSGIPEVELMSGSFNPLLRYQVTKGKTSDVETIDLSDKHPTALISGVASNWISNCNGFLGIILDPLGAPSLGVRAEKIAGAGAPTRLGLIDYPAEKYPGYLAYLPLQNENTFRAFAGPYDDSLLKVLDGLYDDPLTGYNPNYISAQSIQGWFSFISQPFTQFLYFLIRIFYGITHSWGISIILLTIALRVMMYPLNNWSTRSMLRMQEIAPQLKAIQERYKKDPKKAQMEQAAFYRSQGVNPFGGCLPMILQMPFLMGMFYLLKSSFPLRGASFIPGWIDNLAAPDVLFSWDYSIIFIGSAFHLLPILLGLTMYYQQKLSTTLPTDGRELTDTQKQQKMMATVLPLTMTLLFYSFPSGLNIYFISSTLLGILQQYFVMKKLKPTGPVLYVKK